MDPAHTARFGAAVGPRDGVHGRTATDSPGVARGADRDVRFLIASGSWVNSDLFWWPVGGVDAIGVRPLPEFDRPFGVLIVIELAAIAALVVIGRRLGLDEAEHRRNLLATGRVPKERLR